MHGIASPTKSQTKVCQGLTARPVRSLSCAPPGATHAAGGAAAAAEGHKRGPDDQGAGGQPLIHGVPHL